MNSNINWIKTKKKVENVIIKYICCCLFVDYKSTSEIQEDFILEELALNSNDFSNIYINLNRKEKIERIKFINYFRFSFNKLTTEERKIIYWTYLDKENNYDYRFIANNLGFSLGYYYIKKKKP